MSEQPQRPNGASLEWLDFEDEAMYYERLANRLLTHEEREQIKAMMRPTIRQEDPRQLICFGTGSKW